MWVSPTDAQAASEDEHVPTKRVGHGGMVVGALDANGATEQTDLAAHPMFPLGGTAAKVRVPVPRHAH